MARLGIDVLFKGTNFLRLLGGLLGSLLLAAAINVFIVPQGLYGGGAYGLCQVIRTLVLRALDLELPFDLAGLLYLLVNLPMFYLAYRGLGRTFFVKATIVTVCNSIFSALIPSPATPIIEDALTSCLIGGIGVGFAAGLVLSCGCSTGGLDILGLYLSKKNPKFTVGRFCICFNVCLYTLCFILFNATTAIYSAIYNILNQQKQDGVGVLFVGEDLDVLLELCDRIVVLCGGQVSGVVDGRKTNKLEVGALMTRVEGGKADE